MEKAVGAYRSIWGSGVTRQSNLTTSLEPWDKEGSTTSCSSDLLLAEHGRGEVRGEVKVL